jgi:RHS repeat-associated protein
VNLLGQRDNVTTSGSAFAGVPANWGWYYDSMGQISLADSPTAAYDRVFEHDIIGNRKKFAHGTLTLPGSDNYVANALNQYTLVPNYTPQPVHDLDGNLTRGPVPGSNGNQQGDWAPADATEIKWDAENRMISCTIGTNGNIYNYEYDHLSRLITRRLFTLATGRYHYDGWNRIAEFSNTTLLDTFTWGLDLSGTLQGAGGVGGLLATRWVSANNSPNYFPTYDGNGNVVQYLTTAGVVNTHYEYDPFGTLTRRTGDGSVRFQYRFSTKPRDSNTGLYYYLYRWYDAPNARWLSQDPIGEDGGLNLYAFLENDGLASVDLNGLISCPVQCGGNLNGEFGYYQSGVSGREGVWGVEESSADGITAEISHDGEVAAAEKPCCCDSIRIIQFVKTNWLNQASTKDGLSLDGNYKKRPYYPFPEGGVFPDFHPKSGQKFSGIIDAPNRSDEYLKGNEGNDLTWHAWTFAVCIRDGTVQKGGTGTLMLQGIEWGFSRLWNKNTKTWGPAIKRDPKCIKEFGKNGAPTKDQIENAINLDGATPEGRVGSYYRGNAGVNGKNPWIQMPLF